MTSRRNDDQISIPEDVDPEDEQRTDGLTDIRQEANLDNLMKGS